MKKITMILISVFVGFALAKPVKDVLYPSLQIQKQVCLESYQGLKGTDFNTNYAVLDGKRFSPIDEIAFQTPLGSLKSLCNSQAKQLRPMPTTYDPPAVIYLTGTVKELRDAKNWAAAISVKLNSVEVDRVFPNEYSDIADTGSWKPDCKSDCVWVGTNSYYFSLNDAAKFQNAVLSGGTVELLTQKNGVLKAFPLPDTLE